MKGVSGRARATGDVMATCVDVLSSAEMERRRAETEWWWWSGSVGSGRWRWGQVSRRCVSYGNGAGQAFAEEGRCGQVIQGVDRIER